MDTETAFLSAALPEPVNILGQALRPYSLGHEILLQRIRSPFVTDSAATVEELKSKLFTAVYICCFRYQEAHEALRSPSFARTLGRWRRFHAGSFFRRKTDLGLHLSAFVDYIRNGSQCPTLTPRPTRPGAVKPGTPILALYLVTLLKLGVGLEQALEMPYGMARWLYASYWEGEGSCVLTDFGEMDLVRQKMAELNMVPLRVNGDSARRAYGL